MITAEHPSPTHSNMHRWKAAQILVWIAGAALPVLLFIAPNIGLHLLWNGLIPVAPLLLILAPGAWRNVCPLGSTALFARRINRSARKKIQPRTQGILNLSGLLLLFLILPLRHLFFDTSGPASALLLLSFGFVALIVGTITEWKSGWCAGLCPVHPVEKLYGSNPVITTVNAHCTLCEQCVIPCPDSTKGVTPLTVRKNRVEEWTGSLIVGGFPGFIWGWFQVPDYNGDGANHLAEAYLWPLVGMALSLSLFLVLKHYTPRRHTSTLVRFFACASIACYYWFRIPALFGFGLQGESGLLVDAHGILPDWFPHASHAATTALLGWFLLLRKKGAKRPWTYRPPFST